MARIDISEINSTETNKKTKKSAINEDVVGEVSYTIGTGKHAQDSVVWLTIKWSFNLGLFLSILLVVFMWTTLPEGNTTTSPEFPIENLKTIWSIFVPIVTLALGYMFGKGK
jgi:hypothetical protein